MRVGVDCHMPVRVGQAPTPVQIPPSASLALSYIYMELATLVPVKGVQFLSLHAIQNQNGMDDVSTLG